MLIDVPNVYEDKDLWNSTTIRKYNSLDLKKEINSETAIISIQKATIEMIDGILEWLWIKEKESISVKKALWRSWFTKIISKDLWQIWFLTTKASDSVKTFIKVSDYYLWGSDIWNKIQSRWVKLDELSIISWKKLWNYKTELLMLIWLNTLNRIIEWWNDISNFEIDILATKFTPTLVNQAINKLPRWFKKPMVDTVDSNSELAIQVSEYLNNNIYVWWAEIVQSGNSLIATNNAIIRNNNIIMPSVRNWKTWEFEWKIIWKVDPNSQVWRIANSVQTNINLSLYKVLNKEQVNRNDFICAIWKQMDTINWHSI